MIQIQRTHYDTLKSRKTAKLWASITIRQCWKIIYKKWASRNERLHNPPIINKMEGNGILNKAIKQELHLGINNLPIQEFAHLYKQPEHKLLKKSLELRKSWFATVEQEG